MHVELTDKLIHFKSQSAAADTVSKNPKSVGEACEHPEKRARGTRQRKNSSATPFTTTFLAILVDQQNRLTSKIALKRWLLRISVSLC